MNEYGFELLCGIDEFGRKVETAKNIETDKQVGLFYFLWVNCTSENEIYDLDKLLSEKPRDLWDIRGPEASPSWGFHFWGEPLYGYYTCGDNYVLRKHVEMLSMAGVDYLLCDNTNAQIYPDVLLALMQTLDLYNKAGWKVPKIASYTNSYSPGTVRAVYDIFYAENNRYPDVWYTENGKPVIIANDPDGEIGELYDFFEVKQAQWPNEQITDDGFPWMEWVFPQPNHNGVMSVSVAQHNRGFFVLGDGNWGRGNDHKGNANHDTYRLGQNFEAQWDNAIAAGAKNVFVTGWNEWGAQKINYCGNIVFVDCYDEEYSRDLEPMKGGYNDAFYLQLIRNIRRYKEQPVCDEKGVSMHIDPRKGFEQWDAVPNTYRNISFENYGRSSEAAGRNVLYTTAPAKNNIRTVKVTHDKFNLYFLVETESDITEYDGTASWMNLFIGVGELSLKGWEGYEYVVNRRCFGSFDKINKAGHTITKNSAFVKVEKNLMQVIIPRYMLGADENCSGIFFKVADSVEKVTDINDYYVTGKSMPMGRLSYRYNF